MVWTVSKQSKIAFPPTEMVDLWPLPRVFLPRSTTPLDRHSHTWEESWKGALPLDWPTLILVFPSSSHCVVRTKGRNWWTGRKTGPKAVPLPGYCPRLLTSTPISNKCEDSLFHCCWSLWKILLFSTVNFSIWSVRQLLQCAQREWEWVGEK